MSFKRKVSDVFPIDVTVPVINELGGYDNNTLTAIFRRASATEAEALRQLPNNKALVRKQLKDWILVDTDTKETVPFSPEALDALLEIEPTPHRMALAFWEGLNGSRAKP